ncbi:MAG TPA: hypothetical protein VFL90_19305 [Methylomirabilota bacterium]|nr:hypothetical protein [Methylomirabilota bacterium]
MARPAWRVAVIDRGAFLAGAALGALILVFAGFPAARVIRSAMGIPKQSQGLGGLINAVHNLEQPAMVAAAALAPLGIAIGGGAVMLGHRYGMRILGGTLAGLLIIGVGSGFVE